jgi:hypothetical protein
MTSDRKKPGVAFWFAVVMVVAIAYPLSMGPAWWMCHKIDFPGCVIQGIDFVYEPIWWAAWNGPEWFRDLAQGYLNWWTSGA